MRHLSEATILLTFFTYSHKWLMMSFSFLYSSQLPHCHVSDSLSSSACASHTRFTKGSQFHSKAGNPPFSALLWQMFPPSNVPTVAVGSGAGAGGDLLHCRAQETYKSPNKSNTQFIPHCSYLTKQNLVETLGSFLSPSSHTGLC